MGITIFLQNIVFFLNSSIGDTLVPHARQQLKFTQMSFADWPQSEVAPVVELKMVSDVTNTTQGHGICSLPHTICKDWKINRLVSCLLEVGSSLLEVGNDTRPNAIIIFFLRIRSGNSFRARSSSTKTFSWWSSSMHMPRSSVRIISSSNSVSQI